MVDRDLILAKAGSVESHLQVYDIAHNNIDDLKKYLQAILKKTGMGNEDSP